jgi:hypothetical protein
MCLQKGISIQKIYFDGILKVTDEKSRTWSRIRPLVKGTDPHTDPYQIVTDPEHWGEDFYTLRNTVTCTNTFHLLVIDLSNTV